MTRTRIVYRACATVVARFGSIAGLHFAVATLIIVMADTFILHTFAVNTLRTAQSVGARMTLIPHVTLAPRINTDTVLVAIVHASTRRTIVPAVSR